MSRTLILICLGLILAIMCSCGGGAGTPPVPPSALSITTASLPDWMVTFPYTQNIQAAGGVPPFSWSVSSGNLPHGLAFGTGSNNFVTISGTPDIAQAVSFKVHVTDAKSQSASVSYTVNIKNLAGGPPFQASMSWD